MILFDVYYMLYAACYVLFTSLVNVALAKAIYLVVIVSLFYFSVFLTEASAVRLNQTEEATQTIVVQSKRKPGGARRTVMNFRNGLGG